MAYEPTVWQDGGTYGASAFNNIENGIVDLYSQISQSGGGKSALEIINIGNGMKKLRTGLNVEFCFLGDSVFYALSSLKSDSRAIAEDSIPDRGESYSQRYGAMPYRNPVTIYDEFKSAMNVAYEGKVSIKKKVFSGHTAKLCYEDYNASMSDFCIINLGINDAMGAHIGDDYKGHVDLYVEYMKKLIERELDNGTGVVIMTPTKQTLVLDSNDTDDRTIIDVYEQVCIQIAKEYQCPVIDGNEITRNFGVDMMSDFTHFTDDGYRAIGYRMASYFIGQGPYQSANICTTDYLGVNPQLDNVNTVSPTILNTSAISPNTTHMINSGNLSWPVDRNNNGTQAVITRDGKIIWSFYAPEDFMVVIPCFYTPDADVHCQCVLDFGAVQGQWSNYWLYVDPNAEEIPRDYREPSQVLISNSDMKAFKDGKVYGIHMLTNVTQPILRIASKGWHTVMCFMKQDSAAVTNADYKCYSDDYNGEIASVIPEEFGDGSIQMFGISIMPLATYHGFLMKGMSGGHFS